MNTEQENTPTHIEAAYVTVQQLRREIAALREEFRAALDLRSSYLRLFACNKISEATGKEIRYPYKSCDEDIIYKDKQAAEYAD